MKYAITGDYHAAWREAERRGLSGDRWVYAHNDVPLDRYEVGVDDRYVVTGTLSTEREQALIARGLKRAKGSGNPNTRQKRRRNERRREARTAAEQGAAGSNG